MSGLIPGVTQLLRLWQTESTQTVAKFLAQSGAPAGTLVWADRQTAGRGRLERRWSSPEGGLYFSLVLRPDFPPDRLADFGLAAAARVAATLSKLTGKRFAVKPPNDVVADGAGGPRKVCGILAEASGAARRLDWLIVGVGVNVNVVPAGLPTATSLKALTGHPWPVERVLARLAPALRQAAVFRKP